jgi:hypothetical protein
LSYFDHQLLKIEQLLIWFIWYQPSFNYGPFEMGGYECNIISTPQPSFFHPFSLILPIVFYKYHIWVPNLVWCLSIKYTGLELTMRFLLHWQSIWTKSPIVLILLLWCGDFVSAMILHFDKEYYRISSWFHP